VDDEVEVLRCPSDVDCYQRVWGRPNAEPEPMAAYDDIGTSYHFNTWALYDVEGDGIPVRRWRHHGRYWMILNRLVVRDVLADFAPRYAFYYEDPVDFGVGNQVRLPGKHGAFSRHVVGFLDGHAD
jgi:hypothetical protein